MMKFIFIFISFFLFSDAYAGSGCVLGTSGDTSGLIICAVDSAKSNVTLVATGLIAMAAVMMGVYLITRAMNR